MAPSNSFLSAVPLNQLYVWVLAPHLETSDPNIDYYYDFSQSIAEYSKTFNELDVEWKWQPVTINNYASVIANIAKKNDKDNKIHLIFNLCDGDEVNGTPGISVVKLLEEKGLFYTGSDEYFYHITTSKIPMKKAFDKAGVPTAPWEAITERDQKVDNIISKLGSPVIVKPSVSGGSMGVGIRNVVNSTKELCEQVQNMFDGYRGWQLTSDGIVAESFINGPEYTVLIVGSYDKPGKAKIYEPVERIFHPSLPDKEKFLSFDRLWEIYEEEKPMPDAGNFYEYELPDAALIDEIKRISWEAFVATKGKGYTRVDLRMDKETRKIYVLEVNAQCGLSEDEDYTSIGAILRLSGKTFTQLVVAIINDAYQRKKASAKALKRKGSIGIS
ncbi:MAG: ATP-grasp domain-containing protein [Chitinophagaceae bacterium]|nr:ATP-grasp domain-containing protein [Chitinophagaceae bacterium]